MATINLLHLSDVHLGTGGTHELWPQTRASFFEDLEYLIGEAGPIDVVVLSGDVAFSGTAPQFDHADAFLLDLFDWFAHGASLPAFVAVPGNHDLQRPPTADEVAISLRKSWSEIQDAFWKDASSRARDLVDGAFTNYATWLTGTRGYWPPDVNVGLLPGDFAVTLKTHGRRLGLLGLNTTFRQLSDEDGPGSLSVGSLQIQEAAGGDLPAWARANDFNIFLTHHPLSWLDPASQSAIANLVFNEPNRFRVHIFGHLHTPEIDLRYPGSPTSYLAFQAPSLFGLESWGTRSDKRIFGYSLLGFDLDAQPQAIYVWPREAYEHDGAWSFDSSRSSIRLRRGKSCSDPIYIPGSTPATETGARPFQTPTPHFHRQLERARFVLVLGDGVQGGAVTPSAAPVATSARTRELLCEIAQLPDDPSVDIESLLTLALRRDASAVKKALEASLLVGDDATGGNAQAIAAFPFFEAYDLTLSDALDAAVRQKGDRTYASVRSIRDDFPVAATSRDRTVLKVHGTAAAPFLRWPQIGDRLAPQGAWFGRIHDILASHPILFLADDVDGWRLWEFLALRGERGAGKEIRPRSYLVTLALSELRREALHRYNVEWIDASVSDFAAEVVSGSLAASAMAGRQHLKDAATTTALTSGISYVRRLRQDAPPATRRFLLGYEPTWGDAVGQYVVELSSEEDLLHRLEATPARTPVVVIGTAGSGKSTLLRRVGLALDAGGDEVAWVDRSVRASLADVERMLTQAHPSAVLFDDIDIFGTDAVQLIEHLRQLPTPPRIVAAIRAGRTVVLEGLAVRDDVWIDQLTDNDIARLARKLRNADLLGKRILEPDADIRSVFERSRNQLLVAMIEITSGMRFKDRVRSELMALDATAQQVYGTIAVANHIDGERPTRELLRLADRHRWQRISIRAIESGISTTGARSFDRGVCAATSRDRG